jgi:hypothetical protein
MSTPLSPAAQAVLDAFASEARPEPHHQCEALAAALRTASDKVIRELRGESETENYVDTGVNRLLLLLVRDRFNSIASELEGQP